ncbi:MAG: sigma-70 family polymerase sigma factor [Actinomycetia bacterium]|nr:sigma-70 family polymerase sigma factor [Actinomycetes bacterium]
MPLGGQDGQINPKALDPDVIDLRLVSLAVAGDTGAFDELYRRHAPLARRVAWSVLHDDRDADDVVADAFERLLRAIPADRLHDRRTFRAYLLVTTKNLALNVARGRGRRGDRSDEDLEGLPGGTTPLDDVVEHEETVLVRRAYAALPERWRSVLWLTEVEGLAPKAVADLLGLSANGVSQLAVRARAGLRESYLQAHVDGPAPDRCRFTRERLAAHAGGALPAAEAAEVERHLAECDTCQDRHVELLDLAGTLRRAAIPVSLVVSLTAGGARRLGLRRISWSSARGLVAAAAVVTLVLGGLALTRDEPAPALPAAPAPTTTVPPVAVVPSAAAAAPTTVTTPPASAATTVTTTPVRAAAVPPPPIVPRVVLPATVPTVVVPHLPVPTTAHDGEADKKQAKDPHDCRRTDDRQGRRSSHCHGD